jgi:hypothetical protein
LSELVFDCVDVQPDRYGASPTLLFKLRISETTGETIHAMALRCQMRIEPVRRRYTDVEADHLMDLFGEQSRWGETLNPIQFANVSIMVPGFQGSTEIDLPVPCTYDLEVAGTRFFNSLEDGEIPLLLLFSGSVFTKGATGFAVERVPWHKEAQVRLPVATWRQLMDLFFPGTAWIRVSQETIDALQRYKGIRAIPTWDQTLEMLLKEAAAAEVDEEGGSG